MYSPDDITLMNEKVPGLDEDLGEGCVEFSFLHIKSYSGELKAKVITFKQFSLHYLNNNEGGGVSIVDA